MKSLLTLQQELESGALDAQIQPLCGPEQAEAEGKRARLLRLIANYRAAFGDSNAAALFSSPGRTELGGNHTDHQRGCVLAGAVNMDMLACAAPSGSEQVHILSAGYPDIVLDLSGLTPRPEEAGTSAALVRGIASRFRALGFPVRGFRACIDSAVLGGSGLSSSAAYEVLIGVILNHLFCGDQADAVQLAQIGQYAENHFFGKPCGLMDQLASAAGGIISIDFCSPAAPEVRPVPYDLSRSGYALCLIDSGADHANLTDEYAAIPAEMGAAAACFGKTVLREVDEDAFWGRLAEVRQRCGDRAALRAMHFFADSRCALEQAQALCAGDFPRFLSLVRRSGQSSAALLQNLYCTARPGEQAVGLTIAMAERLLAGEGAVRVHGGGFAGTVQAYVPAAQKESFRAGMEAVLGKGCCHFLHIRPRGGVVIA